MEELKNFRDELIQALKENDAQQKICKALVNKATAGETKAIELITETLQEQKREDKNLAVTIRVLNADGTQNTEYKDYAK